MNSNSRRKSNQSKGQDLINISEVVSLPSNPNDLARNYVDNLLEKAESNIVHA
jgi:hypothetical protein